MNGNIEVILVDIGNTQLKYAEVIDGSIGAVKTHEQLSKLMTAYSSTTPFMACSTRPGVLPSPNLNLLDYKTSVPIKVAYETPETLGMDRLAAAVGAHELFPNRDTLIIDMGTCITMDLVTKDATFLGGIITPGLKMRMKSMNAFTANLPDISERWQDINLKALGSTTEECLLAGSLGGVLNEIQGAIDKLSQDFTSINVILTGGDAQYFESNLKAHIFAGSKIVLTGLYRIWKDLQEVSAERSETEN